MLTPFAEVKLFQVRPDRTEQFDELTRKIQKEQIAQPGCLSCRYMKRFYIFDRIGDMPRPLTKVVKSVKYYSYWEFATIEDYARATEWFFGAHGKELQRLLIMPFDINAGYSME